MPKVKGKLLAILYLICLTCFLIFLKLNDLTGGLMRLHFNSSLRSRLIPSSSSSSFLFFKSIFPNKESFLSSSIIHADILNNFSINDLVRNSKEDDLGFATPLIFHYLPHLENNLTNLLPIIASSKSRNKVWLAMGIATVLRKDVDYLTPTIESLISNLNEQEKVDCVIIICVTEIEDSNYLKDVLANMKNSFNEHLESGLIEIISTPLSYYPNLTIPTPLFGDSVKRARWRRKQNLDYIYLMMYAQQKAQFYLQLEDDIIAGDNYYTQIKEFALGHLTSNDWFYINFSKLGFIGKFFRRSSLSFVIEFLLMFYKDKPCDWLLLHLIEMKTCDGYNKQAICNQVQNSMKLFYNKALFQHMGKYSSLQGKIQTLKEKNFIASKSQKMGTNPPAIVSTSLEAYQQSSIQALYLTDNEQMFWGKNPKIGDVINITFFKPIKLERYAFYSGNSEHPGDRFYDTDLQIRILEAERLVRLDSDWSLGDYDNSDNIQPQLVMNMNGKTYYLDKEGYLTVNSFKKESAVLAGRLNSSFGPIKSLRLIFRKNSPSWVILTKIVIIEAQQAEISPNKFMKQTKEKIRKMLP